MDKFMLYDSMSDCLVSSYIYDDYGKANERRNKLNRYIGIDNCIRVMRLVEEV